MQQVEPCRIVRNDEVASSIPVCVFNHLASALALIRIGTRGDQFNLASKDVVVRHRSASKMDPLKAGAAISVLILAEPAHSASIPPISLS